jgi:putative transcriptional regulator
MPIRVTLDAMLQTRGITAKALAEQIGISETQLSLFRSGKVRGLRFATLSKICLALDCQPADLLNYEVDVRDASPTNDDAGL